MDGISKEISSFMQSFLAPLRDDLKEIKARLEVLDTNIANHNQEIQLLNMHETKNILRVSRGTVYKLIDQEKLNPIKLQGKLFFERTDIIKLINNAKTLEK